MDKKHSIIIKLLHEVIVNSRSGDKYRSHDHSPHYISGRRSRSHDHLPRYTSGVCSGWRKGDEIDPQIVFQ